MVLVQAPQKAPVAQPRPTVPQPGMSSGGAAAASALAGLDFSSIKIPKPGEQSTSRPPQRVSYCYSTSHSLFQLLWPPKGERTPGTYVTCYSKQQFLLKRLQPSVRFPYLFRFSKVVPFEPSLNRLHRPGLYSYHNLHFQLKCSFQILNTRFLVDKGQS